MRTIFSSTTHRGPLVTTFRFGPKLLAKMAVFAFAISLLCSGCGTGMTVLALESPTISQVSPQVVTAGTQSVTVTVQGAGFQSQASLTVNGAAVPTTVVNSTTIAANISGATLAQPVVAQLQVKNSNGGASNQVPFTVTNAPDSTDSLSITTTQLPSAQAGSPYKQSLNASGGTTPYKWNLSSGSLPSGLTLSTAGMISGTPTISGTYTFGVTVVDSATKAQSKSVTYSIVVTPQPSVPTALSISTISLGSGQVGTSYSASLSASGGTPSYTWSLASGRLPAGLTLSSAGVISGAPTASGTSTFAVQVKDSGSPAQTQSASESITVNAAAPSKLTITSTSLAGAKSGSSYSATLSASGGTPGYSWSIASGKLPAGLTLSSSGAISGTPTASGTATFTVQVQDSGSPAQTASAQESIAVSSAPATLTITSTSLGAAQSGSSYSATLSASGGTPGYSWSIASGKLPAGLSLSSAGVISGTATASGTATFTVQVQDSGSPAQTASAQESIAVSAAPATLTIMSTSLGAAQTGSSYSASLSANGGTPGYSWSIASGKLPAGLTLSSAGAISGTPTASGTATFMVQVQDSSSPAQTASKQESIAVSAAPATLTVTSTSLGAAQTGSSYSTTLSASGGTPGYSWSIASGKLPAGLSVSSAGVISGTPTASGTATFTVQVQDSGSPAQTASAQESIAVTAAPATLTVTSTSLAAAQSGSSYNATLSASGGTPNYSWSVTSGSLPAGLSLSSAGVISGTPTASGTASFTVTVSDSGSPVQTASANESIAVSAVPLAVTTSSLSSGSTGSSYSATLSATGGTPSYTWSVTSGNLPAGLTLSSAGLISGVPTTSGTSSFTVGVSDGSSPVQTATAQESITVNAAQANGAGTIWFVRPDGGTRYSANVTNGQCDGQADIAYADAVTANGGTAAPNLHCAFNDVRYMWLDGTYGNSQWVMAGGDTLVIRGCAALPSQQNPDAPHCRIGWDKATGNDAENFWCAGLNTAWGCSMPPPPNGTATQHTRILGACAYGTYSCNPVIGYPYTNNNLTQLFGGFGSGAVMYLSGASYVDVEGLEITSHNGGCTRVGAPAYPAACNTSAPVSDYAEWGIVLTNTTSNITMQDLYIHGLTNIGIGGPIGGPMTLTRVSIDFNAFAGWNFDDGYSTPDAAGSSITQSYVTMVGNGCLEEYPIAHTQFPAKACWDSGSGGFGDSWSGQGSNMDSFTCDHCYIAYNAKDGAMGPHTIIHNLSLTNSMWVGNMGQSGKWGQDNNATFLFQNNLMVGNCMRMSQQLPGAAQTFDLGSGLPGAYLSNYCRAAGPLFDYFAGGGSTVNFNNNTIVTYQPTIFEPGCFTSNGCATAPYNFTNNIILGYTSQYTISPFDAGQAPGLYYLDDNSVQISASNNIEYGVRNGDSCGTNGIICSDPLFVNEPAAGTVPPESTLDNFNFQPASGSPAISAGKSYPGAPTTDYYGNPQTSPLTIGAVVQ